MGSTIYHHDTDVSAGVFLQQRFRAHNGSVNTAMSSGSTFGGRFLDNGVSAEGGHYSKGCVFDAAYTEVLLDDGVRIGFVSAVSDGLGHPDDPNEQKSLHEVAWQTCFTFAGSGDDWLGGELSTDQLIENTAELSKDQRLKNNLDGHYQSSSTLTGAIVAAQEGGDYRASFCNVGDGYLLVLDGRTLEVKGSLVARDYNIPNMDGIHNYSPQMLQNQGGDEEAAKALLKRHTIIREDVSVASGDFVVLMTDGIWPEFETTMRSSDEKIVRTTVQADASGKRETINVNVDLYREKSVDEEVFTAQLKNALEGNEAPTAYDVMCAVNRMAAEHALAERKKHAALVDAINTEYKGEKTLLVYVDAENQKRFKAAKTQYCEGKYPDEAPNTVSLSGIERRELMERFIPFTVRELAADLSVSKQDDLASKLEQHAGLIKQLMIRLRSPQVLIHRQTLFCNQSVNLILAIVRLLLLARFLMHTMKYFVLLWSQMISISHSAYSISWFV